MPSMGTPAGMAPHPMALNLRLCPCSWKGWRSTPQQSSETMAVSHLEAHVQRHSHVDYVREHYAVLHVRLCCLTCTCKAQETRDEARLVGTVESVALCTWPPHRQQTVRNQKRGLCAMTCQRVEVICYDASE